MNPLPDEVREFVATLKGDPVRAVTAKPLRIDPRGRPGPHAWRVCDWCGATWHGAYDGIAPFWKRSW